MQHAGPATRACTNGTRAIARREEWVYIVDVEYARSFRNRKATINDTEKVSIVEAVEEKKMGTGKASI